MPREFGHLIELIVKQSNMDRAFDEVVDKLPEPRRGKVRARRDAIIEKVRSGIADGSFRVRKLTGKWVHDGPKDRYVHVPDLLTRIGSNAIIDIVEQKVYPSVIPTSAASIPGRGMHKLFLKIRRDVELDPDGTMYFYHGDIEHYYDNVVQDILWQDVVRRIKDPILLPILENFVRVLPSGISKGLRSSQFFGNIHLSDIDHHFKDVMRLPYYYRYCDDFVILSDSKRKLWAYRDILSSMLAQKCLWLKTNETVHSIGEGLDFLGYVFDGRKARVRKRTKVKVARRLARVRSRKRRQKLIGSFKGLAKWGDCRNLYKVLTGNDMDFNEFKKKKQAEGIDYRNASGKRLLDGQMESLRSLVNMRITVLDFEPDVPTKNGPRYAVQFRKQGDSRLYKYLTDDSEQKFWLREAKEADSLPFECTITAQPFGQGKVRYQFT